MITKEENETLTRVGPGTPGGEMLRRYWWPVELSEYLKPKDRPKKIRVLGENLVLFREGSGRPGLLALNCSHRGTSLEFGRALFVICRRVRQLPMSTFRGIQSAEDCIGQYPKTVRNPKNPTA